MLDLERNIKIDFFEITFEDIAIHLENEDFFREKDFYLIEPVTKNKLVFHIYANKLFGPQIQLFKYNQSKKELTIKSRYKYKIFPGFYVVLIGLLSLTIQLQYNYEYWIKYITTIILMLFLGFVFGYLNLQYDSKLIERELVIRLKYILRKRGYKTSL